MCLSVCVYVRERDSGMERLWKKCIKEHVSWSLSTACLHHLKTNVIHVFFDSWLAFLVISCPERLDLSEGI